MYHFFTETKEGTYKNLQKKYDDKQSLRKKAEDRNKTMELIKLHKFEKLNLESQKANAEHRKLNKDISSHQTSLTKSKADADKKSRDTKKYDEPIKQLRDENDALDIRQGEISRTMSSNEAEKVLDNIQKELGMISHKISLITIFGH